MSDDRPTTAINGNDNEAVIDPSEWVWCGYPGHFIASQSCRMHLHTRVGDWRISTVGDYRPLSRSESDEGPQEIGLHRYYETAVVEVSGHGEHGEGDVIGDHWIYGYEGTEPYPAERGHMEFCRLAAQGWTPDNGEPDFMLSPQENGRSTDA